MKGKPNLFVIGAAKSGTTTIFDILNQHPDIFCPTTKEPKYFSSDLQGFDGPGDLSEQLNICFSQSEYENIFKTSRKYKYYADCSPDNLYYAKTTAQRIHKYSPDARIIVVLRDPIERSFSQFTHMRRDLRENHTNIIDASNAYESKRKFKNYEFMWDYIGVSNYEKNLNHFLKIFHSNVLIIDFKNLMANQHGTACEIFSFLDLKKVNIQEVHSNKSGVPPSNPSIIYRLLKLNGQIRKAIRDVLISLKIHNIAKRISQKIQFLELEKKQLQSHEKDYLWTYLKKEVEFYNSLFNEKN